MEKKMEKNIIKNKIWFYLCIAQAFVLIVVMIMSLWSSYSVPKVKNANLKEYLEETADIGYLPDVGYIPDAKTAKIIGSQLIDKMVGNSRFHPGGVAIEYDEDNRLWLISKGYFYGIFALGPGGVVVIEQDSGKIVKAFKTK